MQNSPKQDDPAAPRPTGRPLRFIGMPDCLVPDESVSEDRYTIVRGEGPRNLARRPLDFRNPLEAGVPLASSGALDGTTFAEPEPDRPDSFNYYINDHAAIGLPDGPECALVDRHGRLSAYSGTWSLGVGESAALPAWRHRHLPEEGVPIVAASCESDGITLTGEFFAAEIPEAPEIDYPVQNSAYVWVGALQPRGRNLFMVARYTLRSEAGGEVDLRLAFAQQRSLCVSPFYYKARYSPPWEDLVLAPAGVDRLRLQARDGEAFQTLGILDTGGAAIEPAEIGETLTVEKSQSIAPDRPAAQGWTLRRSLAAGETWMVTWLLPLFPFDSATDAPLLAADPDRLRSDTVALWRRRRAGGLQIEIPEAKVRQAFLQALNHLDITAVGLERTLIPTPGPSGGHHVFYVRDNVDLVYAADLMGEHERAERMARCYEWLNLDQETSVMTLWLLGARARLTQDPVWARAVMHLAIRAMSWLVSAWLASREANDGLLPASEVADNEQAIGHYLSYHLYAVAGVRDAVRLARLAGDDALSLAWQEVYEAFSGAVLRRLDALVATTDGVLTPCFEGFAAPPITATHTWKNPPETVTTTGGYGETGGCDWHNVAAVFPTGVLPPHHPAVDSSLARWRECYLEGTFPYAQHSMYQRLHNYNVLNLSGTWLRRGDWAETVRDLYGVLLHLSSTHASGEVVDASERIDFGCTPHNWFGAKFVRFVRDLLVYEGDDARLHLLGGLSPAWMKPGARVGIASAPTELGPVTFSAAMRPDGIDMTIAFQPRPAAQGLALHLPPFLRDVRVVAGGQAVEASTDGGWWLPSATRAVRVDWPEQPVPRISFVDVVEAYIEDFVRRSGNSGAVETTLTRKAEQDD